MTKLPSDSVLARLYHIGVKDDEIAAQYDVRKQAVSKRLVAMGLRRAPVAERVRDALALARQGKICSAGVETHHSNYASKNLKVYLRLRLGDESVGETAAASAERMVRRLVREQLIIDYARDEGWVLVPRRSSDDRWIVRWPEGAELPATDIRAALGLPSDPDAVVPATE